MPSRIRILVVEASQDMHTLIAEVLTAEGHEVQYVANGAAALALLEQRPVFDLILSDLTLPAIEGTQLYWEITSRWPHLASRLICVTGGHDAGAINHVTLRAASVPFMVKPFVPWQLRDLVRRRLAELGTLPRPPDRPEPLDV
jgi:DNA-binding NtrC family response regulator